MDLKRILEEKHDVICVFSPLSDSSCYFDIFVGTCESSQIVPAMLSTYICGLEGVKGVSYHKCEKLNVWYIQTDGGTLKNFYSLENVDTDHTTTNNVWDIYNTFGIEAAREFRISEMTEIMGDDVDFSHIKLRADRLTFTGTVQSLTRYTMRGEKPFSKVGFEEIMENFYKTARDAEVDDLSGVSASIMCGKRANVGTSMFDIKLDMTNILNNGYDNGEFVDYYTE